MLASRAKASRFWRSSSRELALANAATPERPATIEVYGSRGALAYSVERPGELDLCVGPDACRSRRWRTVTAPDRFGDPGSIGSLEAYRLAQARTFVESIRTQTAAEPSFADGLACQEVLDAVVASAAAPAWVSVDRKAS